MVNRAKKASEEEHLPDELTLLIAQDWAEMKSLDNILLFIVQWNVSVITFMSVFEIEWNCSDEIDWLNEWMNLSNELVAINWT